jgi:ABC-type phosphate transport system substrate-binding protein
MTKKTKQIIIGAVVVIIAFVVFKVFLSNNTPSDTTLVPDQTTITVAGSQDILALLSSLNKVTLDQLVNLDQFPFSA